ncbi:MAG: hypothetical protein WC676_01210 [Candidatus Omnitrophota bacterium]
MKTPLTLKSRNNPIFKTISLFLAIIFPCSNILPSLAYAQNLVPIPPAGNMVMLSPSFTPAVLKGLKVFPEDPLRFDFVIDWGESKLKGDAQKNESMKLIKYFLAALTTPEDELWVNLSPYEKNRIIPQELGTTEMGKDLLAQDYLLKQLTASLIYPEKDLGKSFWDKVYQKAYERFGTTEIPINTFNKVWIMPDKASVYEQETAAFVTEAHLKVMLEEDYLALSRNLKSTPKGTDQIKSEDVSSLNNVSSAILKEVIIPEIEKEVNTGENFATLRQIYNSLILAAWYKQALKETLLGKIYVDQKKVSGVDLADKNIKQKIYDQYIQAFKAGVYNYIKEDYDAYSKETVERKYISGGFLGTIAANNTLQKEPDQSKVKLSGNVSSDTVRLVPHSAVNEFISRHIPRDLERNKKHIVNYRMAMNFGQQIRIIPIIGLLRSTGQLAHIGLGQAYGEPVVYIDNDYANNRDIFNHEIFEIAQWEKKRKELGLAPNEMRQWILEHFEEAQALALQWHTAAPSVENVYQQAAQLGRLPSEDITAIYPLENDINLAAGNFLPDKGHVTELDILAVRQDILNRWPQNEHLTTGLTTDLSRFGYKPAMISHMQEHLDRGFAFLPTATIDPLLLKKSYPDYRISLEEDYALKNVSAGSLKENFAGSLIDENGSIKKDLQVNVQLSENIFLADKARNGMHGFARLGFLSNGRPVVALSSTSGYDIAAPATLRQYNNLLLADQFGIGPKVHGIFKDPDGKINFVMDIAPGDLVAGDYSYMFDMFGSGEKAKVNVQTLKDLVEIQKRLSRFGMLIGLDFQANVSQQGRLLLIDADESISLVKEDPYPKAQEGYIRYANSLLEILSEQLSGLDEAQKLSAIREIASLDPLLFRYLENDPLDKEINTILSEMGLQKPFDKGRVTTLESGGVMVARIPEVLDPRPVEAKFLNNGNIEYLMTGNSIVNPENGDLTALYGGAGADVSTFLLALNATTGYFISQDYENLTVEDFETMLKDPSKYIKENLDPRYQQSKLDLSSADYFFLRTKEKMVAAIALEMLSMGVDLSRVKIDQDGGYIRIKFYWNYLNGEEKERAVTLINADITKFGEYAAELDRKLEKGLKVGAYYQRAGYEIPSHYADGQSFINSIDLFMEDGGFYVTDDWSRNPDYVDGETSLDEKFVDFGDKFPIANTQQAKIDTKKMKWFSMIEDDETGMPGYGEGFNIRRKILGGQQNVAVAPKDAGHVTMLGEGGVLLTGNSEEDRGRRLEQLIEVVRGFPYPKDAIQDYRFNDAELQKVAVWLLDDGAVLPDEEVLLKLVAHLSLSYQRGYASSSREKVNAIKDLIAQKWQISVSSIEYLIKFIDKNAEDIHKVSASQAFELVQSYLANPNKNLKTRFTYIFDNAQGVNQRLRQASANIKRISQIFSEDFRNGRTVLKAPIEGTPYFLGMRFGLGESTFGTEILIGEETDSANPMVGVFFRIGWDSDGEKTIRNVRIGAVRGKTEIINKFWDSMHISPDKFLFFAYFELAKQNGFEEVLGIDPSFIPADKRIQMPYQKIYKQFGLTQHHPLGLRHTIERLSKRWEQKAAADENVRVAMALAQKTYQALKEIPSYSRIATEELSDDNFDVPEVVEDSYSETVALSENNAGQALPMSPETDKGGIDFGKDKLNVEVQKEGQGIAIPLDLQTLENIRIDGFIPVIIQTTPFIGLPLFLGISDPKEDASLQISSAK